MKQGFDFIGVTCVFYCHDGKGSLLLHKRSQKCRDEQGRWDCGGGALRFGETFEKAVMREIREEYCSDIKKLDFVGINNVIRKSNGLKTHWIAILFACELNPKRVKIGVPKKMDQIGWFKLDKLPQPLHSMFLTHLEFVKRAKVL